MSGDPVPPRPAAAEPGEASKMEDSAERFHALMVSCFHAGGRPEDGRELGLIERLFWEGDGPSVHKWHHYLPLYDRYFGPFRGKPARFLEIGVFGGGSLWMWRRFFGPGATIFGLDIDPACAAFDGNDAQVRIGSQDDPAFLARVVEEMGGIDLVLDDGSHDSGHIRASLAALFPRLSEGGLYMIEDLHAAYWPHYSGGYGQPQSFMSDVKAMIDDLHHWYHDRGELIAATAGQLGGLHVHDSITILEKRAARAPRHSVRRAGPQYRGKRPGGG